MVILANGMHPTPHPLSRRLFFRVAQCFEVETLPRLFSLNVPESFVTTSSTVDRSSR